MHGRIQAVVLEQLVAGAGGVRPFPLVGEASSLRQWRERWRRAGLHHTGSRPILERRQNGRCPRLLFARYRPPQRVGRGNGGGAVAGRPIAIFLIYRRAGHVHRPVGAKHVRVRFRVTDRQPSPVDQTLVEPSDDPIDDRPVEIDHDVAAEDQVERGDPVDNRWIGVLDEIVILKRDPLADRGADGPRAAGCRKPVAFDVFGCGLQRPFIELTALTPSQKCLIDIGGENLHVPAHQPIREYCFSRMATL